MKIRRWCEMFPRWEPGQKERWEGISEQGKFRFVLVHGVLIFGGWCASGVTLLMYLSPDFQTPLIDLIMLNFSLFAFSGALYGHIVWWATNQSYEESFGRRKLSAGDV